MDYNNHLKGEYPGIKIDDYHFSIIKSKRLRINARKLLKHIYTPDYCDFLESFDKNINNMKVLHYHDDGKRKKYKINYNIFFNYGLPPFIRNIIMNMPINNFEEEGIIDYEKLTKKFDIHYNLLNKFDVDCKLMYKFEAIDSKTCFYYIFILVKTDSNRPMIKKFTKNRINEKLNEIFTEVQNNIEGYVNSLHS